MYENIYSTLFNIHALHAIENILSSQSHLRQKKLEKRLDDPSAAPVNVAPLVVASFRV